MDFSFIGRGGSRISGEILKRMFKQFNKYKKTINPISSELIEHKKGITTYDVGNLFSGLGQTTQLPQEVKTAWDRPLNYHKK